jgi:hypothetical protein
VLEVAQIPVEHRRVEVETVVVHAAALVDAWRGECLMPYVYTKLVSVTPAHVGLQNAEARVPPVEVEDERGDHPPQVLEVDLGDWLDSREQLVSAGGRSVALANINVVDRANEIYAHVSITCPGVHVSRRRPRPRRGATRKDLQHGMRRRVDPRLLELGAVDAPRGAVLQLDLGVDTRRISSVTRDGRGLIGPPMRPVHGCANGEALTSHDGVHVSCEPSRIGSVIGY